MEPAQLFCDAGLKLVLCERYEHAETALRAALEQSPDRPLARFGLAHALLGMGRYAEGFPLLRSRFEAAPGKVRAPSQRLPEWKGELLSGKTLLVMSEQGFGDQIMLARFLPVLRGMGAKLMLATRPELASLMKPLCDTIIPMGPGCEAVVPAYDYWTHLFSLPEMLGITLENLPGAPYLQALDGAPIAPRGGVGLCWRTNDPGRSLPDPLAERLLDRGLRSLHPEDTGARDFAETAAIIERLDLMVTIDTATAHLAGAMGKPVWVLLPGHGVDWRWMRERSDSPWYPSARLFRQTAGEGWEGVLERVEAALR